MIVPILQMKNQIPDYVSYPWHYGRVNILNQDTLY